MWVEQEGRWVPEGWLRPGYYADPPQFDPRPGEKLNTPSFEARCFQAPPAREKIDVVIPLSAGSRHGDAELRYALRSMCRHFEDLGRVWVIGPWPAWLRGVEHIPARDDHSSKDINIIRKLELACRQEKLSERFVFWSDDQVLADPSPEVRVAAGEALGAAGAEAAPAVLALSKALRDEVLMVRVVAARALGEIGPKAGPAVPKLLVTIEDKEPYVRQRSGGGREPLCRG